MIDTLCLKATLGRFSQLSSVLFYSSHKTSSSLGLSFTISRKCSRPRVHRHVLLLSVDGILSFLFFFCLSFFTAFVARDNELNLSDCLDCGRAKSLQRVAFGRGETSFTNYPCPWTIQIVLTLNLKKKSCLFVCFS